MKHRPGGQGIVRAIKNNAIPAKLYKKDETAGSIDRWRPTHATEEEDINIYIILSEAERILEKEEEEDKQWVLFYNIEQKLELGWQVRFPDNGWRFLIRKTTQRPAISPAYYKAWGVMQD